MQAAPDMPAGGLETWSPGKLILVGLVLGFLLARLIEPAPPTRVVRFFDVSAPPPAPGGA